MTTTAPEGVETMTTDTALATLTEAADQFRAAEAEAQRRKAARDDALVAAQAAGATYPQMAKASSLSRDRVAQVLARKRQER